MVIVSYSGAFAPSTPSKRDVTAGIQQVDLVSYLHPRQTPSGAVAPLVVLLRLLATLRRLVGVLFRGRYMGDALLCVLAVLGLLAVVRLGAELAMQSAEVARVVSAHALLLGRRALLPRLLDPVLRVLLLTLALAGVSLLVLGAGIAVLLVLAGVAVLLELALLRHLVATAGAMLLVVVACRSLEAASVRLQRLRTGEADRLGGRDCLHRVHKFDHFPKMQFHNRIPIENNAVFSIEMRRKGAVHDRVHREKDCILEVFKVSCLDLYGIWEFRRSPCDLPKKLVDLVCSVPQFADLSKFSSGKVDLQRLISHKADSLHRVRFPSST